MTLQSIGDAVITTDIRGKISGLNKAAELLTGWKNDDVLERDFSDVIELIDEKTHKRYQYAFFARNQAERKKSGIKNKILVARDGSEKNVSLSREPVMDTEKNIYGFVLSMRDITIEKKQHAEVVFLSYHDKLTGLYNRTFMERELRSLQKRGAYPVSIIIGDVNGLKLANDIFGHSEGDRLLVIIAGILSGACRPSDVLARWGGDEFAIALPCSDFNVALAVCNSIKQACLDYPDFVIQPSLALGTATQEDDSQDMNDIIKKAEDRMYGHKILESKSKYNGIVASLERTLFERSYETEEHALRLAGLSQRIGNQSESC